MGHMYAGDRAVNFMIVMFKVYEKQRLQMFANEFSCSSESEAW